MYLNRLNKRRAEAIIGSLENYPNISSTGSVNGMIKKYGWERGASVRHGNYIYHIGKNNIDKIRQYLK